jgi:hypothetical protein
MDRCRRRLRFPGPSEENHPERKPHRQVSNDFHDQAGDLLVLLAVMTS